jgi:hypothetical protein
MFAAPSPANCGFRPLNSGVAPGISARPTAAPVIIEIPGSFPSFPVPPFVVWSERLLWFLLHSAEHEEAVISAPLLRISPNAGRQNFPG